MLASLEAIPTGIVVFDSSSLELPHCRMLAEGLEARPEKWQYLESAGTAGIKVYRLIGHEGKTVGKIRISANSGLISNEQQ